MIRKPGAAITSASRFRNTCTATNASSATETTIGPTWQKNAHGVTVRQREDAPELARMLESLPALAEVAKQVEYFLGSRHRVRFLKKEGYGKFAMLNAQAALGGNGQPAN